jgi:hypothetical protein
MSNSEAMRGIPSPPRLRPLGQSLSWRVEQLMPTGYDELFAHRFAADGSVDLHALLVTNDMDEPRLPGQGSVDQAIRGPDRGDPRCR